MRRSCSTFKSHRTLAATVLVVAVAAVASPSVASAAPPSNDDFDAATVVAALPFSESVDLTEATLEPGEPGMCGVTQSAWYAFTPSSDVVMIATQTGSNIVNVFRADGAGLGGLAWLTCGSFGQSAIVHADAGATYYVQAGSFFGSGGTTSLQLDVVPPPANDDFADAAPFSAVPFADTRDAMGATTEPGEPVSSCAGEFTSSLWYSFTPTTSGTYSTAINNGFGDVDVYTGPSLTELTRVACSPHGGLGTWQADAGTTYYLQAGTWLQQGTLGIRVDVAPPPAVSFGFGPQDPSSFDGVQFFDFSFDPGNVGISSRTWDFGDGTTGDGPSPTHRYSSDGDYTVTLTGTTADGRSNSAANVVQVRTHDVALVRINAPDSARVGKTVQIVVKLANSRYPETVQVELLRSVPSGFEQVATSMQGVPVLRRGDTISFKFNYTLTAADAALGKVSFKAIARLVGARDALLGDNEAVATPTKVKP